MFIKDGKKFDINSLQVIDDVQYPVGWFHDAWNRAAFGVIEADDPPEVIAARAAQAEAQAREAAKAARAAAVERIVVEVAGKRFDGDETSQGRMARAIIALESAGVTSTTWVLADNVPAVVTPDELRMALVKAGLAQTAVWVV